MKYTKEFLLSLRNSKVTKSIEKKRIPYLTMPGPLDFIKKWETPEVVYNKKRKNYKGKKPWEKPNFLKDKDKTYLNIINSLLNKITIENYTEIQNKLIEVCDCINNSEKEEFIQIILNKSKDEHHFIDTYLKIICKLEYQTKLLSNIKNFYNKNDTELKKENEILYRKREQGIGYFIGKMVNKGIIFDNDIIYWINTFIDQSRIECMCKYIQIVDKNKQSTSITNKIMKYLKGLVTNFETSFINSKQKFMIQDIMELQQNNWKVIRESHKELRPDTKENIRKTGNKISKVLSEDRIDSSVKSCLNECFNLSQKDALNEVELQFKDYRVYSNYTIIKKKFINISIENCLEKDNMTQLKTKIILNHLYKSKIIQHSIFEGVFKEYYEIIDDLRIDIPNIDTILSNLKVK